jgi:hypothetical protein
MNNKTEQLAKLFEEWENEVPGYKGLFVKDGIINEELFESSKHKILYVMKEPNDTKKAGGDFKVWWKGELQYSFSFRIAEWSYGIFNDFPHYDKLSENKADTHKTTQQIALMNIKKIGGGGVADNISVEQHYEKCKHFVKKQLEIIDPEIIILGLSFSENLRNSIFPNTEWKKSGFAINIGRYKNCKIIDFYHPASRNVGSASYSLLQNVIQSENFRLL